MNKIIFNAINKYALSEFEDYYVDFHGHLRARGFFYDEATGIFINDLGDLEYDASIIEDVEDSVRSIIGFAHENSVSETVPSVQLEPALI